MIPIAFGITDLDPGGAEHMLVELVTRLDRTAWHPSVVCLQPKGALAVRLEQAGVMVTSLDMRGMGNVPRAVWQWRRILRREHPAILQTFLFHANLLGRFAGRWARVRHIVGGIRVAERRYRWPIVADRWTHRLAEKHVCVSNAVRQFTTDHAGIATERLMTIPNGVDVKRFDAARAVDLTSFGVEPGHATLVFLGRLDRQKGLDDLLIALVLLSRRLPLAKQLRVLVIGQGPLRQQLEQEVARNDLNSIVHLVGWQPAPESWLAAADGLVLPSRWEGMPNAVLEAMAARRPVIATSVEGTSDLVLPGKTGWIVPPGKPEQLADAMEQFLADGERRQQFGQAGRDLVERKFSLERMVDAYSELYDSLLRSDAR